MKKNKKGFTLIELIIVISIIGLIGGGIVSLLVFGFDVFGMANRDFDVQSDMRVALEETNSMVRDARAMFAVPGIEFLDDEWNYIGLKDDATEIISYEWDPISQTHIAKTMVGPYDGATFKIGFYKEDSLKKDNTIQVYFEMFTSDGTTKRFNIQTGYQALNSLQVVDYGSTLYPATALAYRSDAFEYENYLLKVNITLILDVSGSMDWNLNGNTTSTLSNRRNYIMKEKTKGLIESFAQNTNGDVEINIALVPFSTSANGIKVFRNVKTQKANLLSDVESMCTGNKYDCTGGTNTGDGMRRAYYALLAKTQGQINDVSITRDMKIKNYNIFLTDGETTYRSIKQIQSGQHQEDVCIKWKNNNKNNNCTKTEKQWFPDFSNSFFVDDGNITESELPVDAAGIFYAGNGSSTSTADNQYVATIGAMLGGILPVTNYTQEELDVKNYIIGFTASVSDTAINFIATSTNTPKERIYRASTGDDLALSFSEIQLSITNDTWHYLGPKLVE